MKGCKESRHHTVKYNDPIPGIWPCERSFPNLLNGKITQSLRSLSSGISHHLFFLHSVSLFPLNSQQAVENAGKRQKDTALINTNTRPWLKSRGSDRERDREWNGVRGSLSWVTVALSTNCFRNPMTLHRRERNKNARSLRKTSKTKMKDVKSPWCVETSGAHECNHEGDSVWIN